MLELCVVQWGQTVSSAMSLAIILYGYSPTRSSSQARECLEGYNGYLETDGYQGYNNLPGESKATSAGHISAVTLVKKAKAHGLSIYGYIKFLLEHRLSEDMRDEQLAELALWSEKLQSIKNRM